MTNDEEKNNFRWYLLKKREQELRLKAVFDLFRVKGIEPVLIKGWAAARSYPDRRPRYSSDIDLAVSEADHETAEQLLASNRSENLHVDLHREFRHLDRVSWDEIFTRSKVVDLNGTGIRVPSPEDHLRILCSHWLTDGGANKERLWDIYYGVQNRPADFDWTICLDAAGRTRRNWTIVTIGVAHKVLGLEIAALPFASEVTVPEWMMMCLEKEWQSGVPLLPLHTCLRNPARFFQQVRKRLPPNAIQATVDMEGKFDEKGRVYYQLGSIFKRLGPSLRRVSQTIFLRERK